MARFPMILTCWRLGSFNRMVHDKQRQRADTEQRRSLEPFAPRLLPAARDMPDATTDSKYEGNMVDFDGEGAQVHQAAGQC
jgi:hypothetical protein